MAWGSKRKWSKYAKRTTKKRAKRASAYSLQGPSWGRVRSPFLTGTTVHKRATLTCLANIGPSGYVYPSAISGLAGSNFFNLAQLYAASTLAQRLISGNIYKEYRLRSFTIVWNPLYVNQADLIAAGVNYGQSFIAYCYEGQGVSNAGSNLSKDQIIEFDTCKQFSVYGDHSWTTRVTSSTGGLADWDSTQNPSTSSPAAQFGAIAIGMDFTAAPSMTPTAVGKFTFTWDVELRTPVM